MSFERTASPSAASRTACGVHGWNRRTTSASDVAATCAYARTRSLSTWAARSDSGYVGAISTRSRGAPSSGVACSGVPWSRTSSEAARTARRRGPTIRKSTSGTWRANWNSRMRAGSERGSHTNAAYPTDVVLTSANSRIPGAWGVVSRATSFPQPDELPCHTWTCADPARRARRTKRSGSRHQSWCSYTLTAAVRARCHDSAAPEPGAVVHACASTPSPRQRSSEAASRASTTTAPAPSRAVRARASAARLP